jgi:hypothetical protein
MREPATCPPAGLPECALSAATETHAIVDRQPFDGTSSLPTDIIVPLETLASASGFEVVGESTALGRAVYRVALPYRQAVPLVMSLQAGGSWRPLSPFDRVDIWIDKRTWFPLRFRVENAATGRTILDVRATSFAEPDRPPPRSLFGAPIPHGLPPKDGDFESLPPRRLPDIAPRHVAGLHPYRSGRTGGRNVLSYVDGLTWLKLVHDGRTQNAPAYGSTAEEIPLGDGRYAYYEPAARSPGSGSLGRRVDVYGAEGLVHLESNLARAELIEVARSLPVEKSRVPARRREGGLRIERLSAAAARRIAFVRWPGYLPRGYRASAAFYSRSRDGRETVTVYFRRTEAEYDGLGIRVTQARPVALMPPTSETFHPVSVGSAQGRYSDERGELEWLEGRTYRAVHAPSLGAGVAVRIARSLR